MTAAAGGGCEGSWDTGGGPTAADGWDTGEQRPVSELARLPGTVSVSEDAVALASSAADWLLGLAADAISREGRFLVALSGGGTPRVLYQALAAAPWRERAQWDRWDVFFGDERAVPPEDGASNYHMARQTLLDHVPVAPERVHRMAAERADLDAAAQAYSSVLAEACPPAGPEAVPRLDCILLGIGENGHTASLFPGDPSLQVRDRWAVRSRADYAPCDRITVTFPVLNTASHVAFLVSGGSKGDALRGVVQGTVPAAGVQPPEGELRWFLDADAAESMEPS